jgi:hypothetical protein
MNDVVLVEQTLVDATMAWPQRAAAVSVLDDAAFGVAGNLLLDIKALQKQIGETFDPHIARAVQAHKALLAEKRKHTDPLDRAEVVLKASMVAYDAERRRRQEEEARKLREIARQAEETRRLDEAAALEMEASETGDDALREEAEFLLTQRPTTVVVAPPLAPKVAGIAVSGRWRATVTSLIALARFVAKNPQYINAVAANHVFLDKQADSMKEQLAIDGVQATFVPSISATPGRRK